MKKLRKQLKQTLSMVLALTMVVGMLSGCGLGADTTPSDAVIQETVAEAEAITLSSQGSFLLSAGETPDLQLDTNRGTVTEVTVTPEDETLVPYQYYTVTITLKAADGETFAKTATVTLDGVELTVKKWAKDQLVLEYTTLALPDTVTTDEMAKVTDYEAASAANSLGTATIQALLGNDLTLYSEDGKTSYVVKQGAVPLLMVPSFVANGEPAQIKDGEKVQVISEHGEEDFPGATGQWYKVAYNGKVGYVPVTFVKSVKISGSNTAEATPVPTTAPKKTAQTRPAAQPEVKPTTPAAATTVANNTADDDDDNDSSGSDSSSNSGNTSNGNTSNGNNNSNNGSNSGNNDNNNNNNNNDNKDDNGNNGNDKPGDDSGNGGIEETVYYQIAFALGGGINVTDALLPKALMVASNYVIDINQLATPSVPGYLFESWYYDSALTKQVQSGDTITSNLTLYAKLREIVADDTTTDTDTVQGADTYLYLQRGSGCEELPDHPVEAERGTRRRPCRRDREAA